MKQSNKKYVKQILKIAVPITLGNIISQIEMLVDRAFLGQMDDLYMSALGNVTTPVWMSISFCFSILMGASILISQKVGAGKKTESETYAASMMKWASAVPFLLFFFWIFCGKLVFKAMGVSENVMPMCAEYLYHYVPVFLIVGLEASSTVIMQTSNYTKPLVFYGLIRSGLNVFLDWVMIFGHFGLPAMGIKGAAIATTISEYVGVLYAAIIFFTSKKLTTRPSVKAIIKAKIRPFLESAKIGVNSAFEDFAWNFGNLMLIKILNSINEKAAGIYSMIFGIEMLVVVVTGAIGNATMTLSGEAIGAKDKDKYEKVCGLAYTMTIVCNLIMFVVCLLIPDTIIGFFSKDQSIIPACGFYLILMCLNLYAKSANIVIGSGIRGSGDTKWMFMTQIFGTFFVIGCALLFVFVFHWGIAGVFGAVIADEIVRALINMFKFRRIAKCLGGEN